VRGPARAAVAAAVLVIACGTSTPAAADLARTQVEIEAVFARRADALARGDRKVYDETYDPDRAALRRWQAEDFDSAVRGSGTERPPRIVRVEPFGNGYMRVYAEADTEYFFGFETDVHIVRRYVRRLGGRWVITEPTREELGAERKRDADASTLEHWAIDDDLAPLVTDEMRAARAQVARFAPRDFLRPLSVQLFPTAETLGPGWPSVQLATHGRGVRLSPVGIGLDDSMRALSTPARFVLRVAFADELREQLMPGITARLESDNWLADGWREYAAGQLFNRDFFKPTCAGAPPPTLRSLSVPVPVSAVGVVFGVRYAHQASLVDFLYERHGRQAYWDLLEAFRADADSRLTFPRVLKTTPDAFYTDWLVWAKKKYC
jgi:hypothetical protein